VDHTSPLGVAEVLITLDGTYIFTNMLKPRGCATPACCTASCFRAVSFGSFPDLRSVERVVSPLENLCRAPSRPSPSSRSPYLCGSCVPLPLLKP